MLMAVLFAILGAAQSNGSSWRAGLLEGALAVGFGGAVTVAVGASVMAKGNG